MILQDGMRRICEKAEDAFYYITVTNENYAHPALPAGAEADILRGLYRLRPIRSQKSPKRARNFSAAARFCARPSPPPRMLAADFGVAARCVERDEF